jgi:hypothetical protein
MQSAYVDQTGSPKRHLAVVLDQLSYLDDLRLPNMELTLVMLFETSQYTMLWTLS